MKIDHVSSSSFDVDVIREFDISFLEFDIEFLRDSRTNCMFIESSEYFFTDSLEREFEYLSFELLLDFECLFESHSCLILSFFLI